MKVGREEGKKKKIKEVESKGGREGRGESRKEEK